MKANQLLLSVVFAGAIAAPRVGVAQEASRPERVTPKPASLPIEGELPVATQRSGSIRSH